MSILNVPIEKTPDIFRRFGQAINHLLNRSASLVDAVDDTAAATAGVPVGQLYRTGSAVKVRVS